MFSRTLCHGVYDCPKADRYQRGVEVAVRNNEGGTGHTRMELPSRALAGATHAPPLPVLLASMVDRDSLHQREPVSIDLDRLSRAWDARCGVNVIGRCRIHQEETRITGAMPPAAHFPNERYDRQRRCWDAAARDATPAYVLRTAPALSITPPDRRAETRRSSSASDRH